MAFQDDQQPTETDVDVTVKWFNSVKGYGFVTTPSGDDAFIHVTSLQAVGRDSIPPESKLKCDLVAGRRGLQVGTVKEIVELGEEVARAPRPQRPYGGGGYGDPKARSADAVREDVRLGRYTAAEAATLFGYVEP